MQFHQVDHKAIITSWGVFTEPRSTAAKAVSVAQSLQVADSAHREAHTTGPLNKSCVVSRPCACGRFSHETCLLLLDAPPSVSSVWWLPVADGSGWALRSRACVGDEGRSRCLLTDSAGRGERGRSRYSCAWLSLGMSGCSTSEEAVRADLDRWLRSSVVW